jgi:hypothetical protein
MHGMTSPTSPGILPKRRRARHLSWPVLLSNLAMIGLLVIFVIGRLDGVYRY